MSSPILLTHPPSLHHTPPPNSRHHITTTANTTKSTSSSSTILTTSPPLPPPSASSPPQPHPFTPLSPPAPPSHRITITTNNNNTFSPFSNSIHYMCIIFPVRLCKCLLTLFFLVAGVLFFLTGVFSLTIAKVQPNLTANTAGRSYHHCRYLI